VLWRGNKRLKKIKNIFSKMLGGIKNGLTFAAASEESDTKREIKRF
jgi:hypothetical protein